MEHNDTNIDQTIIGSVTIYRLGSHRHFGRGGEKIICYTMPLAKPATKPPFNDDCLRRYTHRMSIQRHSDTDMP